MIRMILWRALDAYELLIIISAILSWIPQTPGSLLDQIHSAIASLTEPFLDLFRRIIPGMGSSSMPLDFSPVVAIVVLDVIKRFL